jgi:hypothetical protein
MTTKVDIDIDYNATSAVNILQTYLTRVKREKGKVNDIYNEILAEFKRKYAADPAKEPANDFTKILEEAIAARTDTTKWNTLSLKLTETMRDNPEFAGNISTFVERFRDTDQVDIDIENTSYNASRILAAFLNGYKAKKEQVNALFKTIRDEFNQDTTGGCIKTLDEAIDARIDQAKWDKFVSTLSIAMRANSEFSDKVRGHVDKLRPPIKVPVKKSENFALTGLLLSSLGIFVFGWYGNLFTGSLAGLNYFLVMISMLVFTVVIGLHTTGRAAGVVINSRKLMSLSRLQTVIWTIIILSAYLTVALSRIHASLYPGDYISTTKSITDPLAIGIDLKLWALMGISVTSLIGTPLILDSKKGKEPDEKSLSKSSLTLDQSSDVTDDNRQGLLYGNPSISDAAFTDIFEGDELANTSVIDLSKVQMFWFTMIVAFAYLFSIYAMISSKHPSDITDLPALSGGLIAILAISHVGYLANKSITRTGVEKEDS